MKTKLILIVTILSYLIIGCGSNDQPCESYDDINNTRYVPCGNAGGKIQQTCYSHGGGIMDGWGGGRYHWEDSGICSKCLPDESKFEPCFESALVKQKWICNSDGHWEKSGECGSLEDDNDLYPDVYYADEDSLPENDSSIIYDEDLF